MVPASEAPFFYGGPIPTALASKFFYGFEEERRILQGFLNERNPGRFGVLGPQSCGKTSLIMAVAARILVPRSHVDCARTWPATRAAFYRNLLEAMGIPPPSDFDLHHPPLEAYSNFPVPKKGTRGILVLENAHTLEDIDPNLVHELPIFGARLPYHLILTGEPSPLRGLCASHVELQPFSEATAAGFMERQFQGAGVRVDPDALSTFYEFTRGTPEALQRLGSLVWERVIREGRNQVVRADVEAAVADAVERLPSNTLTPWAATRGLMRDIFIAMCLYDLASPTGIAQRLEIEAKNVVVLLGRLESVHRLIDKVERGRYRVRDPLLKHYVRKEWGSPILR